MADSRRSYLHLLDLMAMAAMPALLVAMLLPEEIVLPAIAIMAFLSAVLLAAYAYLSRSNPRAGGITAWDMAGIFAILWVIAGTLTEPEHVLQLFGHRRMAP